MISDVNHVKEEPTTLQRISILKDILAAYSWEEVSEAADTLNQLLGSSYKAIFTEEAQALLNNKSVGVIININPHISGFDPFFVWNDINGVKIIMAAYSRNLHNGSIPTPIDRSVIRKSIWSGIPLNILNGVGNLLTSYSNNTRSQNGTMTVKKVNDYLMESNAVALYGGGLGMISPSSPVYLNYLTSYLNNYYKQNTSNTTNKRWYDDTRFLNDLSCSLSNRAPLLFCINAVPFFPLVKNIVAGQNIPMANFYYQPNISLMEVAKFAKAPKKNSLEILNTIHANLMREFIENSKKLLTKLNSQGLPYSISNQLFKYYLHCADVTEC